MGYRPPPGVENNLWEQYRTAMDIRTIPPENRALVMAGFENWKNNKQISQSDVLSNLGMTQGQVLGGQNEFLTNLLQQRATGMNPAIAKIMQMGKQQIGRQLGKATGNMLQQSRERLAGSGISGANILSNLLEGQANALGDALSNLATQGAQLNMQSQENATKQLQQQNFGQANLAQGLFGNLLQNQQFGRNLGIDYARLGEQSRQFNESQPGWEDILGGLLGGAGTALTGFGLSKLFGEN